MRITLVALTLCAFGGLSVKAEAPVRDGTNVLNIAKSREGRFRILNANTMIHEASGKSFGISAGPATLRLSASGQKALTGRQFSLRLFRSDVTLGRPRPIGMEDGCEIYYSAIVQKDIVTGDLVFTQFNEYWLGRRGSTLGDETYILIMEDGLDDNGVIKLRPGLADKYFQHGFRIVVTRSHELTPETVKRVIDWVTDPGPYQQLQRDARCVDSPNLQIVDLFSDVLVARLHDCNV